MLIFLGSTPCRRIPNILAICANLHLTSLELGKVTDSTPSSASGGVSFSQSIISLGVTPPTCNEILHGSTISLPHFPERVLAIANK